MSAEQKRTRLRLILIVAASLGCSSTVLSGTLAAFAAQQHSYPRVQATMLA